MLRRRAAAVAAASVLAAALLSAQDIRQERVTFEPGASSATLRGTVKGYQTVDYVLGAKAGQTMTVSLKTAHGANYFNVLPPGSDAAIAMGEVLGNTWSGTLPVDGDYRIRVYLMRSAARRNETATYTLTVGITGHAAAAPAGDAKVPGTPYHATGTVPCSVGTDPKGSMQCSFGVIRQGSGPAEVHLASAGYDVRLHKDKIRVLRFTPTSVTSADPKEKVTFGKRGDNWEVAVNGAGLGASHQTGGTGAVAQLIHLFGMVDQEQVLEAGEYAAFGRGVPRSSSRTWGPARRPGVSVSDSPPPAL